MRHARGPTALLFFFFIVAAALQTAPENASAAAKANPKAAAEMYSAAAKDWRALLQDAKRGQQRDSWSRLEKRFMAAAARDPKGAVGAKATFQAARCLEELARRSFRADDWQNAAARHQELAKKFPKHSLADDGLFHAAYIYAKRLNDPETARVLAQTLLTGHPKGDMAPSARELIASLPAKSAAKPPASPSAEKKSDASPKAPAPSPSPSSQQKEAAKLTRIICRGTSTNASVLLELDGTASFRHQYLAPSGRTPARLVIDVSDVALGADVKPKLEPSGMAVSRVRTVLSGGKDKKSIRVVIDFPQIRHYTVDVGLSPPGIHVRCSTAPDLAGGKTPPENGKNGPVVQGRFSGEQPGGRPGTLMEQLGLTVKTIMIDAGHGGKDPGAMGNGIKESLVTLELAEILGERLKKHGFDVLHTRAGDVFIPLDQRAVIANNQKADLLISLHVNSNKDNSINGLETYFLDLARTTSAATVAARENAVSVKSISDLQFILTDLMLTSKLQESQDLAAVIHQKMYNRVRLAGFTVNDNGVRSAPFYVLMGARMPAVLVEIGYLTNAADARRIKSSKYLERLADGIAVGVVEYKKKLSRFNKK